MHNLCLAAYGIAQVMEIGVSSLLMQGKLIDLFPDWPDERFPLYAIHPSRKYLPAKSRAFLDFLVTLFPLDRSRETNSHLKREK